MGVEKVRLTRDLGERCNRSEPAAIDALRQDLRLSFAKTRSGGMSALELDHCERYIPGFGVLKGRGDAIVNKKIVKEFAPQNREQVHTFCNHRPFQGLLAQAAS